MKKKGIVFILEDNTGSSYYISEALKRKIPPDWSLNIQCCWNISDADDCFDECGDEFTCLVCDSNMSPIGLNPEAQKESDSGLYSGWLWLYSKIKNDPKLADISILYTAYFDEIKSYMDKHPEQKDICSKISLLKKRTITGPHGDELVDEIYKILLRR